MYLKFDPKTLETSSFGPSKSYYNPHLVSLCFETRSFLLSFLYFLVCLLTLLITFMFTIFTFSRFHVFYCIMISVT